MSMETAIKLLLLICLCSMVGAEEFLSVKQERFRSMRKCFENLEAAADLLGHSESHSNEYLRDVAPSDLMRSYEYLCNLDQSTLNQTKKKCPRFKAFSQTLQENQVQDWKLFDEWELKKRLLNRYSELRTEYIGENDQSFVHFRGCWEFVYALACPKDKKGTKPLKDLFVRAQDEMYRLHIKDTDARNDLEAIESAEERVEIYGSALLFGLTFAEDNKIYSMKHEDIRAEYQAYLTNINYPIDCNGQLKNLIGFKSMSLCGMFKNISCFIAQAD